MAASKEEEEQAALLREKARQAALLRFGGFGFQGSDFKQTSGDVALAFSTKQMLPARAA